MILFVCLHYESFIASASNAAWTWEDYRDLSPNFGAVGNRFDHHHHLACPHSANGGALIHDVHHRAISTTVPSLAGPVSAPSSPPYSPTASSCTSSSISSWESGGASTLCSCLFVAHPSIASQLLLSCPVLSCGQSFQPHQFFCA